MDMWLVLLGTVRTCENLLCIAQTLWICILHRLVVRCGCHNNQHILINANPCCVLQYMFCIRKLCSHKITDAYRTMKHGLLQGLTAPNWMHSWTHLYKPWSLLCPVVQVPCLQREEFRRYCHTHLPIYVHQNRETWLMSWAHSSISHGDDTILLHTLINFCIQQCKSHVFRW